MSRPTALYRWFGGAGELLYVGMAYMNIARPRPPAPPGARPAWGAAIGGRRPGVLRTLIGNELGEDPATWTLRRLAEGSSFAAAAREMTEALRLPAHVSPVTRQTLRKWCAPASMSRPGDTDG